MLASISIAAESTGGLAWRIALAFLLVIIAVALVYALVRAGKVLQKVEKLVEDLDAELVPVLHKAATTVDEVNAELDKVNDITASVAEMTERVDAATRAVENAVSAPARKAAAFTSGVSQTFASFFGRRGAAREEAESYAETADWASGGEAWSAAGPDATAPVEPQPASEADASGECGSDAPPGEAVQGAADAAADAGTAAAASADEESPGRSEGGE